MADEIAEEQVLEFLERFEKAQGTQDFDRVAPMLHPDALFRFNDGDYRGTEAARGAFERMAVRCARNVLDALEGRLDRSLVINPDALD